MEYLVPKPSDATVTYFADWSQQLGESDTIKTFTLTVTSGTVTITTDPQPPLNFGTFIRFVVAGGANGEIAVLTNTINTVGGQVMTRAIQLAVLDTALPVTPSTAAKRTICYMVFEEVGLAGYEFDATPEEYASMMRRMDAQMAEWRGTGLDFNYNQPPVLGQGDLADESGIPDDALNFVALSIAQRFAPLIGKTLSRESLTALQQSSGPIRGRYAIAPQRTLQRSTPRGAGQKPYGVWWPYGSGGSSPPSGPC